MSTLSNVGTLSGTMQPSAGGTTNYNNLRNKPKINGVELGGNISFDDLDIIPCTDTEIDSIINS